jgi:hypothetical protein
MNDTKRSFLALTFASIAGIAVTGLGTAGPLRAASTPAPAALQSTSSTPDYAPWGELLGKYYDPAKGMDYAALKSKDAKTLEALKKQLGQVDPKSLPKKDQLAYWINVYNVNTVAIVVEHYPVASIRDISTDPIVRLNVFKKETVPIKGGMTSLKTIEDESIRAGFHDPRIHFAINCAAQSCPPIRTEPYTGAKLDEQLDDQAQKFLTGPRGVKVDQGAVHVTKIMDWFGEDFDKWAGGKVAFLRKHLPADKAKQIPDNAKFEYDDYNWKLNDAKK